MNFTVNEQNKNVVMLSFQQELDSRLRGRKLIGFADCYREQFINPNMTQSLSFEERLGACLTRQDEYERNQLYLRLIKNAGFRDHLSLDEISKAPSKGLTLEILRELAGMSWIERGINIAVTGGCGVGKTALACAAGRSVARHGLSVLYMRTNDLLDHFKGIADHIAKGRAFKRIARFKVLILDDFGIHGAFSNDDVQILLDIADQRYGLNPIILCSQYRMGGFYSLFPKSSGSESLLDRLLHPCLEIALDGDSRRGTLMQDVETTE